MDELDIILGQRNVFTGSLYTAKRKGCNPEDPSGYEGRFSGDGTRAYYFGISPETCWAEILEHRPNARQEEFDLYQFDMKEGSFVDVGAVERTKFLLPKEGGGYQPAHDLSDRLVGTQVLGFRYTSHPAHAQGIPGTCFCIYQSIMNIPHQDFHKIEW